MSALCGLVLFWIHLRILMEPSPSLACGHRRCAGGLPRQSGGEQLLAPRDLRDWSQGQRQGREDVTGPDHPHLTGLGFVQATWYNWTPRGAVNLSASPALKPQLQVVTDVGSGVRLCTFQALALLFSSSVTLSKLLNLPVPQFPNL